MLGLFLPAVKWAGVMGNSGVGRPGEQGCHSSMAREARGHLLWVHKGHMDLKDTWKTFFFSVFTQGCYDF